MFRSSIQVRLSWRVEDGVPGGSLRDHVYLDDLCVCFVRGLRGGSLDHLGHRHAQQFVGRLERSLVQYGGVPTGCGSLSRRDGRSRDRAFAAPSHWFFGRTHRSKRGFGPTGSGLDHMYPLRDVSTPSSSPLSNLSALHPEDGPPLPVD